LLIAFASAQQLTLIPRAAGTSLAGQVVGAGIVVDISRYFNRILEINVEEQWARVEPGVIRDDLNAHLKPLGLMFGPETSTANRAMIGGMIGNNSSGLHSIVWGDTRQNLISAEVLLDDGSEVTFETLEADAYQNKLLTSGREGDIYRQLDALMRDPANRQAIQAGYPKSDITRRNTGYALDLLAYTNRPFILCQSLQGCEGTQGIIKEANIQPRPLPAKEIGLLCVHFEDMVQCLRGNIVALHHEPEAP